MRHSSYKIFNHNKILLFSEVVPLAPKFPEMANFKPKLVMRTPRDSYGTNFIPHRAHSSSNLQTEKSTS